MSTDFLNSYFLRPNTYLFFFFLLPTSYFLLSTSYLILPTSYFLLPTGLFTALSSSFASSCSSCSSSSYFSYSFFSSSSSSGATWCFFLWCKKKVDISKFGKTEEIKKKHSRINKLTLKLTKFAEIQSTQYQSQWVYMTQDHNFGKHSRLVWI